MPEAAFVLSSDHDPCLADLVQTLRYELELQAIPSIVHVGGFPEVRPDRVYVLLDPWAFVGVEGEAALPDDAVLRRTILLLAERPPGAADDAYRALLRRGGAVFVLDHRARLALERLEISSRLVRPGYSAAHDRFDAAAPRPLDIVFIGAHTARRSRYLARAASVLARHDCVIHLSGRHPERADQQTVVGDERRALLSQAKVLINLHAGSDTLLEWRGVVDAVHAGAVVVTEHSHGIAPLIAGEHLFVAAPDAVAFVAEAVLRDDARLAQVRKRAYERLRSWLPSALPVSVLRAAMVELVGEPIPSGTALGTPRPSIAPDHVPRVDPSPLPHDATWEPPSAEVRAETPAWAQRPRPAVTAIIAADGKASGSSLAATLGALAASRFGDFELIVADPGVDPEIGATARPWMDENPAVPACLVASSETAPGAAGDAALDRARGELCLMLAAGEEIYPRALGVLVGVLRDAPDTALVYPIQAVDAERLTGYRSWDASLWGREEDVAGPALIRTDRLREIGGFRGDADRGMADGVWRRVADHGWRGELVPQPLAHRRMPSQS